MKEYVRHEIFQNKKGNFLKLVRILCFNVSLRFIFYLRLSQWLKWKKVPLFSSFIMRRLSMNYGCYIGSKVEIGLGVRFPHPNGIVIGETTVIGRNCTIYQQVTFGGKLIGDAQKNNYPKVGDDVVIFAGAKLIGNITIGNNVTIGTNSVVNKSFPSNTIIAGVPARIIKNLN